MVFLRSLGNILGEKAQWHHQQNTTSFIIFQRETRVIVDKLNCFTDHISTTRLTLPTTYRPRGNFYRPITDHLPFVEPTTYRPPLPTTCRPHTEHLYRPHTDSPTCSLVPETSLTWFFKAESGGWKRILPIKAGGTEQITNLAW